MTVRSATTRSLPQSSSRVVVLVTLVALVAWVPGCSLASGESPSGASAAPASTASLVSAEEHRARSQVAAALGVLRRWDGRRSLAYAAGDPSALRRLYAPRSDAAAPDVRLLRRYARRGLVVEQMTTQVHRAEVLRWGGHTLVLRVADRRFGGVVLASGSGRIHGSLPADDLDSWTLTMVRAQSGWVMRAVVAS